MRDCLKALQRLWRATPLAVRSMRRNPGFFLIAASSVAIALGLSTAVFAHLDALIHPYVPVRDARLLYRVSVLGNGSVSQPSGDEIAALVASVPALEGVAADSTSRGTLSVGDRGTSVDASAVPPEYFRILGVKPRLGRLFASEETDGSGVAIVSDAAWKLLFADRATLGNAIVSYDGRDYAVVGVLPPGLDKVESFDLWLPRPAHYPRFTTLLARAKRGVDQSQISAGLQSVRARLVADFGSGRPGFSVSVRSAAPDPFQLTSYHRAMIGAALCILLIACGNVSALMLARGVVAQRDYAVRVSLGATRADLLTMVVAEVFVIAMTGGIGGMVMATWIVHLGSDFLAASPSAFGLAFDAHWNARVFGQALAAITVTIGLAAIFPAWTAARVNPSEPLKDGSGTTTGRATTRFRLLVVAELAVSMMLLLGASLIAKATRSVSHFDFGYDARPLFVASANVVVVSDSLRSEARRNGADTRPRITAAQFDAALDRVRAVPGVVSASPLSGGLPENGTVSSDESRGHANTLNLRVYLNVGPGFMKTLGVPIIEGRDFLDGDRAGRGGIILDSLAAKRLFPSGAAVGRLVKLGGAGSKRPWLPVVGIARPAILRFPTDADYEVEPQVYASVPVEATGSTDILVRGSDTRVKTVIETQRALRSRLPATSYVHTVRWLLNYESALTARRFAASIFIGLAVASLFLAAAGLFSVLSFAVGQRAREFAVRVALGANRQDVVRLVAREALVMALGGTAVGGFLGVWAGTLVRHFLWDISPWDVNALIVAEGTLLVVTALSCVAPALRAIRADPLVILRAT